MEKMMMDSDTNKINKTAHPPEADDSDSKKRKERVLIFCEKRNEYYWKEKLKRGIVRHYCEHRRRRAECKVCSPHLYCKHGRKPARCVECGGTSLCEHGIQKTYCKTCAKNGKETRLCQHLCAKHRCVQCKGSAICKHERRRSRCFLCSPNSKYLCNRKCGQIVSTSRLKAQIRFCARCQRHEEKTLRLEHMWLVKFKEWEYFPTSHDSLIREAKTCSVINKRRADYVFVSQELPYHVIVECDENGHGTYDISCEMKRLQEIHDQMIGNTTNVKPIVVIRFNPNATSIESELKDAMDEVFKGHVDHSDARGVNLFKLIGYSRTRKYAYKENQYARKIKV